MESSNVIMPPRLLSSSICIKKATAPVNTAEISGKTIIRKRSARNRTLLLIIANSASARHKAVKKTACRKAFPACCPEPNNNVKNQQPASSAAKVSPLQKNCRCMAERSFLAQIASARKTAAIQPVCKSCVSSLFSSKKAALTTFACASKKAQTGRIR